MRRAAEAAGRKENGRLFAPPLEHEGKSLDPFQQEAMVALLQSMSTLVSAPTGTGKTLIADFLVQRTLEQDLRIVYTGPVKALVNQKHREFAAKFGSRRVGILTGDVTWQREAPVLVMTTEILRNMLLREDDALERVAWVIFDEIHYIDHADRGAAVKAEELAARSRPLPEKERETVRVTLKRTLDEMGIQRDEVPGLDRVERLWYRGIGLHHAGLLPAVRRVTELLLERRILHVVYATETFAVGVNMPVRSVCFDSLEKFDGRSYRMLTPNEYFQMAAERVRRLGGTDVGESPAPSAWRAEVVSRWCSGSDLRRLERELGAEPGDVVSLCRRSIDLLRQMIKAAAGKDSLVARLREAVQAVDRGVVRVRLA